MSTVAAARPSWTERVVNRLASRVRSVSTSRRGFLGGAAVVGAALAVDPFGYLTRPASAIDAICGADSTCAAGYTVFCCTINGGNNTCPPDSFIGGWWKADHSSFCGGNARYYIDCNAYRDGRYTCHCNTTTCDQRRVACNQFRYGQCSTQIPWSDTGPVLCRVVSCTPPWVQFGGTCSSSSATDNNTATHSAPCLSGQVPVGVVEAISTSNGSVYIRGWAYDPDQPEASLTIAITQDGRTLMGIHASIPRPDVNAVRHITGNHGFEVTFQPPPGKHTYICYAYNVGGGSGNPRLGGYTVLVADVHAPVGKMELCNPVNGSVVIEGWAFDRDMPSYPMLIAIRQDDKPLMGVHCGIQRDDVNSHYGITGLHGFHAQFRPTPGAHNYKVYAINAGAGSTNTLIGNHSLIVSATAAVAGRSASATELPGARRVVGELESVTAGGSSVRLVGWALDPARPAEQVRIGVYCDDGSLHWAPTSVRRPELPGAAGHAAAGFDITLPAGRGVHSYQAFIVEHTDQVLQLGTETVRVDQDGPLGRLTDASVVAGRARLTGWVRDPDAPGRRPVLQVYRDGAPAIDAEIAATDAGFDIRLAHQTGSHSYGVYARPDRPGQRPTMIDSTVLHDDETVAAMRFPESSSPLPEPDGVAR
ncbi:MAG TPA: twin-arginine translocation signal domain-containing protein [Jatrophihabitans sp.]|nr:twin-arginine translocation signal domain-containing protein [Jatrophihabitans sp.]